MNHKIPVNRICIALSFIFVALVFTCNSKLCYAKEPVRIVIDPGHGGENLGGEYGAYTEKEMTLVVARAMKEELEKYEGVEVFLTREDDTDISLKDRVLFAKEKQADFLFCLHFNLSVHHDYFGSEVWVSAFDQYYAKEYSFAEIEMQELTGLGLFSRGIKTKLNDKGTDYYGILRHGTEEGIPVTLIEHCHLDNVVDEPYYTEGDSQLIAFGKLDATAAAKYFQLSSEQLQVSYADYPVSQIPVPETAVKPDETAAETCSLSVQSVNEATGEITLTLEAEDQDSYLLYYNYSLNGGNTYSQLYPWNRDEKTAHFTITVPTGEELELRASVYNSFDVITESNMIALDPIPVKEEIQTEEPEPEEAVEVNSEKTITADANGLSRKNMLILAGICFLLIIILLVTLSFVLSHLILDQRKDRKSKRGKKRTRRK